MMFERLNPASVNIRRYMRLQHKITKAHYNVNRCNALVVRYPRRCIEWGCHIVWPENLPYVWCLNLFHWDHMKCLFYVSNSVNSSSEIIHKIYIVALTKRNVPGVFDNVWRIETSITVVGTSFEQLLKYYQDLYSCWQQTKHAWCFW